MAPRLLYFAFVVALIVVHGLPLGLGSWSLSGFPLAMVQVVIGIRMWQLVDPPILPNAVCFM